MLLSARMLDSVSTVNNYCLVDQVQFTQGDQIQVFFQLIDTNKEPANKSFNPAGRRYMPASGATLQVTLNNIDSAKAVVRAAVQPYPTSDPSIWYVQVLASDIVRGTVTMLLKLTEGSNITTGVVVEAMAVANAGCL